MGGLEQDGGERGGHDTSVLQTLLLLHRHKVWGGLPFTLHAASRFCRGLRVLGSLERHRYSFMVFIPNSITRCDGRDRRVEEDGGR